LVKIILYILKILQTILLCLFSFTLFSQGDGSVRINEGYILPGVIVDGDTLPYARIKPVIVLEPIEFRSHKDYLEYRRLIRDVKKAYPYSLIARDIFRDVQIALDTIKNEKKRKKYVKQKDKELQDQYTDELKKLTITQGRILIKLIDRELGHTSYEVIKEMRGSVSAFMWQSLARLFGSSLKSEYDAVGEDMLIERVLIMIENGQI